jgi:hypothetical protein
MSLFPRLQVWQEKITQKMIEWLSIECSHHFLALPPLPQALRIINRKFQQSKFQQDSKISVR